MRTDSEPFSDNFFTRLFLPAKKREMEIWKAVGDRLQQLQDRLAREAIDRAVLYARQTAIEDLILQTQWLLSVGVDIGEVRTIRFVPVSIYLRPDPNKKAFQQSGGIEGGIKEAIEKYLRQDFSLAMELPTQSGSIWKRFWLRTLDKATQMEVEQKLEAAFDIKFLDKPQAEATKSLAEGTSVLLAQIQNVPHACLHIGTLLLAKTTSADGVVRVAVRTLSPLELKHLEQNRSILQNPQAALELLEGSAS